MLFTLRAGDRPEGLAGFFTRNPARFHELEPINPHLGSYNSQTVPPYPGWAAGVVIGIPEVWDPYNKPVPPTGL